MEQLDTIDTDMVEEFVPLRKTKIKRRAGSPIPNRTPHSYPRTREEEKQADREAEMFMLMDAYEREKAINESASTSTSKLCIAHNKCPHLETEVVNGVVECLDCGQHLDEIMDQEQDWRYYGENDNKNSSNPSRCQFRKSPDKGIRKDLEKLNLPAKIINLADQYYFEVTQGEIKRGQLRKGIMFACVFEAYKHINKHQIPDQLQKLFGIDKKNGSRGLTYFFRRKSNNEREYVTAEHFIPKICEKFNFLPEAIEEVKQLYRYLKDKSPQLDHSYPQSVACGCVYYVMKNKKKDVITGEEFGKIVNLSSITVIKKANEIADIMDAE